MYPDDLKYTPEHEWLRVDGEITEGQGGPAAVQREPGDQVEGADQEVGAGEGRSRGLRDGLPAAPVVAAEQSQRPVAGPPDDVRPA